MARIFISYARQDGAEIANKLANRLRAVEHEVFLDVESIRAGTRWKTELERRIKWSDLIVVLVTPGSNESDFVFEEIKQGETHHRHILPVQIGDTPLPVHLRGAWQAITLHDDNLDRVLLEIEQTVRQMGRRAYNPYILIAAGIALVAIVGFTGLLAFNSRNPPIDMQATENALPTHFAPTTDAEGVTVVPTDMPKDISTDTPTDTPILTLTAAANEQAEQQLLAPLPAFYFANEPLGSTSLSAIYYESGGGPSLYYEHPQGWVSSLARTPDGAIYFTDANDFSIYQYQTGESVFYTHTTYVRTIRTDLQGGLYFSEATGAGGDGVIYRLDGNSATLFYTVRLPETDASWAGDFAFDNNGDLWLSSGNQIPANLYQVVNGVPRRVYTADHSIMGLAFEPGGSLLYSDGDTTIYRLIIPQYRAAAIYTYPDADRISDILLIG